nr:uncharacterized protein LOC125637182 [Caretta caretta]
MLRGRNIIKGEGGRRGGRERPISADQPACLQKAVFCLIIEPPQLAPKRGALSTHLARQGFQTRHSSASRIPDRCGFQLGVCDRHLNNMAWHQGLSNPIPEFQLTLEETALPPESTTTGWKRRRRSVPSQPVTWGAVKALVAAAQRRLAADQQPETPETLFVAILAQITANSVMIVCLLCLLFPKRSVPLLDDYIADVELLVILCL